MATSIDGWTGIDLADGVKRVKKRKGGVCLLQGVQEIANSYVDQQQ